jgi:hypothetical protein
MSLVLRQGLDVDRQPIIFENGELVWTTDTHRLFVGDGVTAGGLDILSSLHNHDDRYYLKSIIDTMLSGKVDVTTFDSHVNDLTIHRTINDSGLSTTDLWSAAKIASELSQKSDITHNHDDRYYTKSEVDALQSDEHIKVNSTDNAAGYLEDKLYGGRGISIITNTWDFPDNMTEIDADVFLATIGGYSIPAYINATKGGKTLSVETVALTWSEANVGNNDWLQIGTARDADTGHVIPFDATIVGGTIQVEKTNGNTKNIRLYVNGTEVNNALFNVSGSGEFIYVDNSFNIDVNAGDKIRIRGGSGGTIEDSVITLFFKWRG